MADVCVNHNINVIFSNEIFIMYMSEAIYFVTKEKTEINRITDNDCFKVSADVNDP